MLTSTILFANNAPNWIDQFKTDLIIKMTSLAILVFVLCFGSLVCGDGNNCHLTYKKMICFRFFRPNIDNCMQKKIPFELETYQKIKICVAGTIQCVSVFAACKGKNSTFPPKVRRLFTGRFYILNFCQYVKRNVPLYANKEFPMLVEWGCWYYN